MSESRKSKDARFIAFLQRVNGQYAPILRWTGLIGFIVFAAMNRPELAATCGGLIPISLVIGKDER